MGEVAPGSEERKAEKYSNLRSSYIFTPMAMETLGVVGPRSVMFIREPRHHLQQVTGEA